MASTTLSADIPLTFNLELNIVDLCLELTNNLFVFFFFYNKLSLSIITS